MSEYSAALAAAAARSVYGEGGVLVVVPISGREAPNVIDLAERRAQHSEKAND